MVAGFYTLPFRWGKVLLLAGSYFFYAWWNWKFIPLLAGLTIVDYIAALLIERAPAGRRKIGLLLSLCANLGFLGFFKYFNFTVSNLALLVGEPASVWTRDIVLPLGISFHTFQSMSYIIDVYRKEQAPIRNFLDYSLFISFFPQLVAGPIVRARDFFKNLYNWKAPTYEELERGAFLFMIGLTKKILFADHFALISDAYFRNPAAAPGLLTAWTGAFAFAMQVFFDFSGYTDMAIGCAKMLGFHFPINFARPYLSRSIQEFWRRWHISLSTWLRDYLYISLGGNRKGSWKTYRNLFLTMLLGGLWHGAAWNFVLFGAVHGVLLSLERIFRRGLGVFLTFPAILLSFGIFRARSLPDVKYLVVQMFSGAMGRSLITPWLWRAAGLTLVIAILEEKYSIFDRFHTTPRWVQATSLGMLLVALELFAVTDQSIPYVYFQF
jgi:alginate O-acetyltransferase complex protein AlgI